MHYTLHHRVFRESNTRENPHIDTSLPAIAMEIGSGDRKTLEKSNNIAAIFEKMRGRFLILGTPGSGKTTILLNLASVLLERSLAENTPIPVVFSLSAWKDEKQSIRDWIIFQLQEKYGLRQDISKHFVYSASIIPFLDDFDKVNLEWQESCARAIKRFLQEQWQHGILICLSTEDSDRRQVSLGLSRAIVLQPLSKEFIRNYIQRTGNFLLQDYIGSDTDLQDFIKTPFFLNILVLAHEKFSLEQWQKLQSLKERQDYLFEVYIEKMLSRSHPQTSWYTDIETKHWLGWLAKRMIEDNTTEFYLEKIHPYWLKYWPQRLVQGLICGLIYGLIYGAILGLMSGIFYGLAFVPTSMFIFGLSQGWTTPKKIKANTKDNKFVENETFSFDAMYRGTLRGARIGLIAGLIIGLFLGLLFFASEDMGKTAIANPIVAIFTILFSGLAIGLIIGAIIGLICGIVFGLTAGFGNAEIVKKTVPNQGIKQSIINSLLILFIGFILGILPSILSSEFLGGFLGYILLVSLHLTHLTGGLSIFLHLSLRIVLTKTQKTPWNYTRFLNYCVDRLFLKQIASHYRFLHPLLQQHFAQKYGN